MFMYLMHAVSGDRVSRIFPRGKDIAVGADFRRTHQCVVLQTCVLVSRSLFIYCLFFFSSVSFGRSRAQTFSRRLRRKQSGRATGTDTLGLGIGYI